jgi:hypothetical protein
VSQRQLPFTPTSATSLVVGDLVGVPAAGGRWGCLQVTDLKPGKRSILWMGVLDWSGDDAPDGQTTAGCPILDNRMTRIEVFTQGELLVHDNRPVIENGHPSNRGVYDIGTVHTASGWRATIRAAVLRAEQ